MVGIPLNEGTITLEHEWPVDKRVEKYLDGEPVVSLEVDTDQGTAVVALTRMDLFALASSLGEFDHYYQKIEEDEWNSR